MTTVIELSDLASRGFTLQGDAPYDFAGTSVSNAGDVNGDGFDDVIIAAPNHDQGAGRAYVIFGGPKSFDTFDLGSFGALDGFVIQSSKGFYNAQSVSAAGDINGDGFDDVIVNTFGGGGWYGGIPKAYIVFGSAHPSLVDLSSLSASDGFAIEGTFTYYGSPFSVSDAGDVNGDGFDDILVGSPNENQYAGSAYVIYGKSGGLGTIDLSSMTATAGFRMTGGGARDRIGSSVSAAGDVNGDGFDDVIVGAYMGDRGGSDAGEAYVVFGKGGGGGTVDLSKLTSADGFVIQGDAANDWAGFSVSTAGDVNADGFSDLIFGASGGDDGGADAGEAYIIFGKAGGFSTIDLANIGTQGFVIQGDVAGDRTGWSVSSAGDFNGDGFADVIIGAPFADTGGTDAGGAYLIFGKAAGIGTVDLTNLGQSQGFAIRGDVGDLAGWSVSAAGDVNRDGFSDLIVGARGGDLGGTSSGQAYIIYGQGVADNSRAIAGDFNGDGRDDILWRHDTGRVINWLGQGNGGFTNNIANSDAFAGTDWHIVGVGDFNRDGRDDALWRNANGDVTDWLALGSGGFASNFGNAFYQVDASWQIAGVGDLNGDGWSDILWRNESGRVTDWLGQGNGGFTPNFINADATAGTDWSIVGIGDFNNDGRDDVLWRNDNGDVTNWLSQPNGNFSSNFGSAFYHIDNSWKVAGIGDFNGDGWSDILWRDQSGRVTDWLGQGNGGFTPNFVNADAKAGADWHIVSVGDFNNDGRDDVLWRNNNGDVTDWLSDTHGGFVSNFATAYYQLDIGWEVQPNPSEGGWWA